MEKRETLDAIYERIKTLEGEICALQVQNKRLRVIIAALVFLAVLPYLLAAGIQTQTFSVLRVERLEFVRDGKLMAAIAGGETGILGYGLRIYDKDGKPMVEIDYQTGGPFAGLHRFALINKHGESAIDIVAAPKGWNDVLVYNSKRVIVASLGAASRDMSGLDRDSGYLFIRDGTGKTKIGFSVTPEGNGLIGVNSRDGKSGVAISGEATGGRIEIVRSPSVSNTKKLLAVTIGVAKNGSGYIETTNASGSPIWTTPLR